MTRRRGASTLGCLFSLFIVVVIVYFGLNIGRVYWRYYEFRDDIRQEVRFAGQRTNDQIVFALRASADSLGLPEEAKRISIRRTDKTIAVEAQYSEFVELPLYLREFRFNPRAEGPL